MQGQEVSSGRQPTCRKSVAGKAKGPRWLAQAFVCKVAERRLLNQGDAIQLPLYRFNRPARYAKAADCFPGLVTGDSVSPAYEEQLEHLRRGAQVKYFLQHAVPQPSHLWCRKLAALRYALPHNPTPDLLC